MSAERLEDRVKSFIVECLMLRAEPASIGDDDDLERALSLDSRSIIQIVIGLEEHFNIQVSDEEFSAKRFATVRKIADVLRKKVEN